MSTTPLERILFLQGGLCFFCNRRIPKDEESTEHLMPISQGGDNHLGNLVACCKTVNLIFGSISLKEKIRTILAQKGNFDCPNVKKSEQQPPTQCKQVLTQQKQPNPHPQQKPKQNGQHPPQPKQPPQSTQPAKVNGNQKAAPSTGCEANRAGC